jgi:hypothetical protein
MVGGILKFPETLPEVRAIILEVDDCFIEVHREILRTIYTLDDNEAPVDLITVAERLREDHKLEVIGGEVFLDHLYHRAGPAEYSVAWYAKQVHADATKRRINQELADVAKMLHADEDIPPENIVDYGTGIFENERARLRDEAQAAPRFHSMTLSEVRRLPRPRPLLDSILWQESVHILYGESSTWKSKVALSMALSIATGKPWLGRAVKQGPVLYIAAEGGPLVALDALVWLNFHGMYGDDIDAVPFRLLTMPPDLCDLAQVQEFIRTAIEEFETDYGERPSLVVSDTLSTSMSGNENEAQDINNVYKSLRMMQRDLGCSALVVHHVGKDPARKERGNYAIRANADATMVIDTGNVDGGNLEPGMPIALTSDKPYKGAAKFPSVNLTTTLHPLIEDNGEQYTSLVVIPTSSSPVPRPGKEAAGDKHMSNLLTMMRNDYPRGANDSTLQRLFCTRFNVAESTYKRAKAALYQAGNIYNENGVWLAD